QTTVGLGARRVEGRAAVVGKLQTSMRRLHLGADDAGMHVLRGRIDMLAADPQASAAASTDGDGAAGMTPAADPVGGLRGTRRLHRSEACRWQPANGPALDAIGRGLVGHAAIGTAGFADQEQIARNEITRLWAALALRRTRGVVGCVLDEMHLRPVGNDFCN